MHENMLLLPLFCEPLFPEFLEYQSFSNPCYQQPQLGLNVPSQHFARPLEQPQTPPCQEQQPLACIVVVCLGIKHISYAFAENETNTNIIQIKLFIFIYPQSFKHY